MWISKALNDQIISSSVLSSQSCVQRLLLESDLDWFWSSTRQSYLQINTFWRLILHQSCFSLKSDPQDLYLHWMIFIFIFWGAFISSSLHHLHLILLRHIIADIEPYLDHVRKISLICIIEISASAANAYFCSVWLSSIFSPCQTIWGLMEQI